MKIIAPTGNHPFFIRNFISNIYDTCADFEIILLVTRKTYILLKDFLSSLKNRYYFEVIEFDLEDEIKSSGIHLKLLDDIVKLFKEWCYIQHVDHFWMNNNWLNDLKNNINDNLINICLPYKNYLGEFKFNEYKFSYKNKLIKRTHDFSALYNFKLLNDNNLKFMWGKVSEIASGYVIGQLYNFRWINRGNSIIKHEDFLDGSDLIGLEIAARFPEKITEAVNLNSNYVHGWDTIGIVDDMRVEGDTIYVNRNIEKSLRGLANYSWISTFLFNDYECSNCIILPWDFINKIPSINKNKSHICNLLEKYNSKRLNKVNIKRLKFLNKEILI